VDRDLAGYALVVVDVQKGFDASVWGNRNNPDAETNVATLIDEWRRAGRPVVFVRHDSDRDGSPLQAGTSGNEFKEEVTGEPDVLVVKHVHSAFYGTPDLHAWLGERGIGGFVVCGVQTNHCVETTARMGGDLGYDVLLALDASWTFDRPTPDGEIVTAEQLTSSTAASLHGEFATVVRTSDLIGAPQTAGGQPR
jgi:nicotinamidase-related amidase